MGKPDTWSPRNQDGRFRRALAGLLGAAVLLASAANAADLQPKTVEAFSRYVQLTEAQMDSQSARTDPFLWVDTLPPERRTAAYAQLKEGKVVIERLETLDKNKPTDVPGGLIHHWIGTVFIPGATLAQTLSLEQDYDRHQDYFQPDVARSKILSRNGSDFLVQLRFYKKKIITTILDTEHAVHYFAVDSTHASSRSHTTRIQEVDNPGKSDERLLPEGHDRGFLWRMNTYWRFEEKDGGTYVESQSISLTRDIPAGLGFLVGPFVSSIPRESLSFTLTTTRSAVLERMAAHTSPLAWSVSGLFSRKNQKVVPARNIFESPFVWGNATRSLENERKLTLWPSPLIDGIRLLPFDDRCAFPPGWLATTVVGTHAVVRTRQVCLTKMFSTPFAVFPPRLEDREAKATIKLVASAVTLLMLGCSLSPLPGVVLSTVETRVVKGVQAGTVCVTQVSRA